MDIVTKVFRSEAALKKWLIASLICNMAIIVTGAIVRLTGSGLGCPTWPQCTETSYIPHGEMGIHGVIEFGNRTLTFVLVLTAVGALVSAFKASTDRCLRMGCWGVLGGILAQAVVGGVTVHMQLNPFVVGIHMFLSIALIVVCTWCVLRVYQVSIDQVSPLVRWLSITVFGLAMVAMYLGTLVTGSGPHSGDINAHRTGFVIETVARIHALSVWALVGVTIAALVVVRRNKVASSITPLTWLLGALAIQGVIGYIQYFTGLPAGVVIAHMAGTSIVSVLASWVLFSNRVKK